MIKLYDFQDEAHELIIKYFRMGLKVLLCIMAGGGKSITAGSFIAKYHKHFKFVLVVRKRDLVEQLAKDALDTFGLDYSIFMAGHPRMDLSKRIQVCSKDTMQARDTLPFEGEENVVYMIDECDEFPDFQREIIARNQQKRFFYFGMTATPFNGLDFFDVVVEPIKPKELLRRGILVDFEYIIRTQLDFSDVGVLNGEWKNKDVVKKLDTPQSIAAAFNNWLLDGEDRQTLVFSSNRTHSKNTEAHINNHYGKKVAVHIDGKTSTEDREKYKQQFIQGIIKFILVVGIFKRGTNIKEIGCIWDQAPTLSLNNHIQKLGRGSRTNDFYKNCLVIDIANNCINNNHFYADREIDLTCKYKKKKSDLDMTAMRVCEKCFRASETAKFGPSNTCPHCGYCNKPVKKKKLSKYAEKQIFMEKATGEQIEQRKMINDFKKILWKKKNIGKRYQNNIAREKAHMDLMKKYGVEKVLKVQKSIGLKMTTVSEYRRQNSYVPLGGLDI